ncbi:short-chain dehydrogenase [Pseudomonas sp. SWRI81]|uniref:short-chain dehydrogenase n=1 Tax=Pseudomonas sp. SWRI81 TaxID=2745505 RepID=UPI0016444A12|nr:short-chain dehydrogenase [Pseudomonas sp. SWRI81]MBC3269775.1 short-chain dehydrogenase [Pseudomonas sp. SWRI81]
MGCSVDIHAPFDALIDAANHRIRTVVQVLENLCMRGSIECDSMILSDFTKLRAIPLRDGCDVLDVIGRRLGAMPS